MRRTLLLAVMITPALLLASCSGDSGDPGGSEGEDARTPTIEGILAATRDAGTMTIEGASRETDIGATTPVTGAVDAGGDPSEERVALSAPMLGSNLPTPFHVRRSGDDAYLERAVVEVPGGVQSFLTRGPDDPAWVRAGAEHPSLRAILVIHDPLTLLSSLDSADTRTEEGEGDDLAVVSEEGALDTVLGLRAAEVTLRVDGEGRLVHVRIDSPNAEAEYTVGGFGSVVDVEPPAEGDSIDESDLPGGEVVGDRPVPDGDLTTAIAGEVGGVPWDLRTAPGTSGTTCWEHRSGDPLAADPPEVRCIPPGPNGAEPADRVGIAIRPDGGRPLEALVLATPDPVSSASLGFRDGTRSEAARDAGLGVVYWVGTPGTEPWIVTLTLDDGAVFDCAPGEVSSMQDVAGLADEDVADLYGAAWSCLAHDDV